jgi:hypothetical protein
LSAPDQVEVGQVDRCPRHEDEWRDEQEVGEVGEEAVVAVEGDDEPGGKRDADVGDSQRD